MRLALGRERGPQHSRVVENVDENHLPVPTHDRSDLILQAEPVLRDRGLHRDVRERTREALAVIVELAAQNRGLVLGDERSGQEHRPDEASQEHPPELGADACHGKCRRVLRGMLRGSYRSNSSRFEQSGALASARSRALRLSVGGCVEAAEAGQGSGCGKVPRVGTKAAAADGAAA
jgi:hypothetical protein